MRSSGAGNRDALMMAIPAGALVLAVMLWFGGPDNAFKMMENALWAALTWVDGLF